jgi:hypothetical protein
MPRDAAVSDADAAARERRESVERARSRWIRDARAGAWVARDARAAVVDIGADERARAGVCGARKQG